jgi:hypothetical protein
VRRFVSPIRILLYVLEEFHLLHDVQQLICVRCVKWIQIVKVPSNKIEDDTQHIEMFSTRISITYPIRPLKRCSTENS